MCLRVTSIQSSGGNQPSQHQEAGVLYGEVETPAGWEELNDTAEAPSFDECEGVCWYDSDKEMQGLGLVPDPWNLSD
jgi:hypothetical protein|tara:strand:- start:12575 stop:12805 length:231 start_codon:yes stop_codon:yes gene_type:complete